MSIVTQCPRAYPNLSGWDTEQSEHLGAHFVATGVEDAFGRPTPSVSEEGASLTLRVTNNTDAPGFIRVFVGCTKQPSRTTVTRRYRGGNPSNADSFSRGVTK